MAEEVVITGLGPISALGLGVSATWSALLEGRSGIARIAAFDPSGFDCQIAGEVSNFKVSDFVPKTYRKATKVMARDIELAVAAADLAAKDARLTTKGNAENGAKLSYDPTRVGAHIGAGLIAAEVNELTEALVSSRDASGRFDIHHWGSQGMTRLTPLWLLKYLPNMLACHVTIVHDAQGPSNTITCAEASSLLSVGESLRVIQRGAADLCFCGGTESKVNPMGFFRQTLTGRLTNSGNDRPTQAVRPFDASADGTVVGEGGAIVTLETLDTFRARGGVEPYARVLGFGASQTVNRATRSLQPEREGKGIAVAMRAALRDAAVEPQAIDLVVTFGSGSPSFDRAEAAALRSVFGDRLAKLPLLSLKSRWGNCGAGAGGLDLCVAALALRDQAIPQNLNCPHPIDSLFLPDTVQRPATLRHALVYSTSLGGQNAALVLSQV